MAATAEFSSNTAATSPPTGPVRLSSIDSGSSEIFFDRDAQVSSPTDDDAEIVRRNAVRASVEGDTRNQASGILDRRKTARQAGGRSSSGDSVRQRKNRKGLGPNIPIRVSPAPAMPDTKGGARMLDDDLTGGDSSVGVTARGRHSMLADNSQL